MSFVRKYCHPCQRAVLAFLVSEEGAEALSSAVYQSNEGPAVLCDVGRVMIRVDVPEELADVRGLDPDGNLISGQHWANKQDMTLARYVTVNRIHLDICRRGDR